MRLVNRLLQTSHIPLTPAKFWWYAFLYWLFFGLIWYSQSTLLWILVPSQKIYLTDFIYWLIELLYWWAITPLIIYCAQRFPLQKYKRVSKLFIQLIVHVCIVAVLYSIELLIEYSILGQIMAHQLSGESYTIRRMVTIFVLSYGTAFSQYMLLVVCYNVLMYIYQLQALKEQNLLIDLTNEQLKGQLANAQLQALKMQLNPHFLFNTLHTVFSLIIHNQTQRAAQVVTSFSDLLRGVLSHQQSNFLSLREELQLTRKYLAIQQIRFEDRLHIEYNIESEVEECFVPQLILQPLVENAITHGIANISDKGIIRISARCLPSSVAIEVFDNGMGHNQQRETAGTGLGLANIRARLHKAYGEKAKLQFEQPQGGTTTVSLIIPR